MRCVTKSGSWSIALVLGCGLLHLALPGNSRTSDLDGKWKGTWQDTQSGHHGPLKATFAKCDDSHYHVVFTGRFFMVFPFRYSVTLDVTGTVDGKTMLSGESKLPLFGVFTYQAEATVCEFVAHFSSRRYQGRFDLKRSE
jgi:hypothetical protein